MNVEFTIEEIQDMIAETNSTRKENLRLQSLTTDEFLLNVLSAHYQDLLNDLAELQTMLVNLQDDSCKSYAQLTAEMDERFIQSVW